MGGLTAPVPPGRVEDRVSPVGKEVVPAGLAVDQSNRQGPPATAPDGRAAVEGRDAPAPELGPTSLEEGSLQLPPPLPQRSPRAGREAGLLLPPSSNRPRRRVSPPPAIYIPNQILELPYLGWRV